MASNSNDPFYKLYSAAVDAYPEKPKLVVQEEVRELWKDIKQEKTSLEVEVNKFKLIAKKKTATLFDFWVNVPKPSAASSASKQGEKLQNDGPDAGPSQSLETDHVPPGIVNDSSEIRNISEVDTNKPADNKINEELDTVNRKIADFHMVKNRVGLSDDHQKQLKALKQKKVKLENKKKRLKSLRTAQQKYRVKEKRKYEEILQKYPEVATKQKSRGRTPLEEQEHMFGLHSAILDIVVPQSSADERRRSEVYNVSCQTLDSLKSKLAEKGYNLSRTALYYRLIPANAHHKDGKRHVNTVPVKLLKPQNSHRKYHEDRAFAKSVFEMTEEFANLFEPESVCYVSQDDKAKVPIGLPISKKQTALLMHLEYKVTLPDHDFVIGEKHKLIPSVYAICKQKDGKISHSGPTFISIRSGKHDSSTASSHQYDFERLLNLEEFSSSMKDGNGIIKPLLFIAVDGGPDEAPSNQKTLIAWSGFFKRHDIDGIFIFNNAPGYSAYNKVERRMAPLSKDTSGIILPFDTFGSHLNSSNKTIDLEREKKNFEEAGKILASVWSETIIDGYPVVSEYQVPDTAKIVVDIEMDQFWIDRHVSQSRYILQITKCKDHSCCNISRTNYEELVGSRYLPPPIPLKITEKGPSVHSSGKFGSLFHNLWLSSVTKTKIFDQYCPKMNHIKHKSGKNELQRRVCFKYGCHKYYPTLKALQPHTRICLGIEDEDIEEENIDLDNGDDFDNDQIL